MHKQRFTAVLLILFLTNLIPLWAGDKKANNADPCKEPPRLLSKPSKENLAAAKKIRAQGSVAIAVDEDGNVNAAKVTNASSREAADLLLERARSMKFAPRPGCGVFKTVVNFTLQ